MGGDDDVMLYMTFLVPFNEFDRGDQTDELGLNPDLFAKFPKSGLTHGLAGFHHTAG
jgi:hypothetical protein